MSGASGRRKSTVLALICLDAGAGADRLVVDLHAGRLVVGVGPLGIHGRGEGAPAPVTFCAAARLAIALSVAPEDEAGEHDWPFIAGWVVRDARQAVTLV